MMDDFTLAEMCWGIHPSGWPVPPIARPRWWQLFAVKSRRDLRELESVFGPLSDRQLEIWWAEIRKGQSVYEDAGGYLLRCYRAMMGLDVEEPWSYSQAVREALRQSEDSR